MTGWWRWLGLELRTARAALLMPPMTASALLLASASSLAGRYDTPAARAIYAQAAQDSMPLHLLQGRGTDLDTLGGMVAQEFGLFALAALPLWGLLLAIQVSRSREDRGLCELITAGTVGRGGPVVGALAACTASAVVFGIGGWSILAMLGFPGGASAIYLGSLVALVIACAALGLLVAQVAASAHQASMIALAGFLGLYVVRAIVDVAGPAQVWFSPLSWLAKVEPFGAQWRWWPIAAYLAIAAVASVGAVLVAGRRDLGAGLFAAAPGPARAPAHLRGVGPLLVRLTRPSASLFAGAGVVIAVVMACFVGGDFGEVDPTIQRAVQIDALFGCALAVRVACLAASEEVAGRCGRIAAEPISRPRWSATVAVVASAWGVGVLALTGLVSAVGIAIVLDDGAHFAATLAAAAGYLPAVVLIGSLAGVLAGVRASWAPAAWVVVGWSVVVALPFSDLLELPTAWRNLSPLEWLAGPGVGQVAWVAGGVMVLGAVAGWLGSAAAFSRRDLAAG